MSEMLYALRYEVLAGTETAARLTQDLQLEPDAVIECDLRPVREEGVIPAAQGFLDNPDVTSLTITRLRNYRPWKRNAQKEADQADT